MSAATLSPASGIGANEDVHHSGKPKETVWRKIVNWLTGAHEDRREWLEKMRGMLSLVSTMIATITFQSSINPPGGVLPAGENVTIEYLNACGRDQSRPHLCPGEAILPIVYAELYKQFQAFNSIAFVASLSVTLLLVSGFPLRNRFPIWLLSIGMIFTLTFLALAYLRAMVMVTPSVGGAWEGIVKIVTRTILTWIALVVILTLFLTVRFVAWLLRFKHRKAAAAGN